VVYLSGTRVGFGRTATETRKRDGREVLATDSDISLSMARFGQSVTVKTRIQTEETHDGELLEFQFELLNPPAAPTRKIGRVKEGRLILDTEVNGKTTRTEMAWDKDLKSPGYQDRLLRENPLKAGEKRKFKSFDPQFGKLTIISLEARDFEEVELLGGEKQKLLKVAIATSTTPGIVLDEFLDAKGEAQLTRMSLLGMATYKVSREEALKSLSGAEADLAVATLVRTTKIERPQETERVIYRVTIPGEDPSKVLAVGPTQSIAPAGAATVDLTVSSIAPPAEPPAGAKAPGDEYLTPNSYLQSDDPLVQKLAEQAAGAETDPWTATRQMERWVHQNLKQKNFSTLLASAAEVAKNLQGDCTEHAVLLAAMARARKIPSRVVVGVVYVTSLSSFGGHMWTEVFINGLWVPLDATLGRGGIGADHIKFADSSFSENDDVSPLSTFLPLVSVLGKLQIEVRDVRYKPGAQP
jgi:transglutaminase-like putative cysteine protease